MVEHPFHVMKNLFRRKKVCYKGLLKNTAQLCSISGLANLVIAKSLGRGAKRLKMLLRHLRHVQRPASARLRAACCSTCSAAGITQRFPRLVGRTASSQRYASNGLAALNTVASAGSGTIQFTRLQQGAGVVRGGVFAPPIANPRTTQPPTIRKARQANRTAGLIRSSPGTTWVASCAWNAG